MKKDKLGWGDIILVWRVAALAVINEKYGIQ